MNERSERVRILLVGTADAGQRLDRFLALQCPDFSRSQIQNALAAGRVTVDDRSRPKSFRVSAGDEVHFEPLPPPVTSAIPQDLPLRIVYEDDDLVVVDKQAGLVVHPSAGHPDGTLVNALLHHCRRLAAAGDPLRPGIVHRLDRDTTGLIVAALSDEALRSLTSQMKRRLVRRGYLALSWGRWPQNEGVLKGAIGRSRYDRQKMAIVTTGGREAESHYRLLEDYEFCQLCRVALRTGRTHQIRVQFAHHGHPIVGDRVYGDDKRAQNVRPVDRSVAVRVVHLAGRQMLHSETLTLVHPRDGRPLEFHAPPPPDMAAALALLRGTCAARPGE
jgi:23S rRNA pseudouridine1911/1915/1917 synthase